MKMLILLFLAGLSANVSAQQASLDTVSIQNFIVEENLLKNNKLAVIAADENERPLESVGGTFVFSLNGFRQELRFSNGVAVAPQPVEKSTFLYLRHENESGTHGKLYFILKRGDQLKPYKISWLVLIVVPLAIISIALLFRKFLIICIIILILLFLFNSNKGLGIGTFFDTIVDGLKGLV